MTWRAALWSSDNVFWFLLWFSSVGRGRMAVRVAYLADFDQGGAPPRGAVVLAGSIQSGPLQPADTRIRSPIRTFMMVALREFAYELSRRLHRAANCRADRFGPMRISLRQ